MKFAQPETPEIFMECYCVGRKIGIRRKKSKLQTATVIRLWFYGLQSLAFILASLLNYQIRCVRVRFPHTGLATYCQSPKLAPSEGQA